MPRKFYTPVELPGDPTAALHAATKQYVDARPVGEVARHVRTVGVSTTSASGTEVPIMRLPVPVVSGRLYKISRAFVGAASAVVTQPSTTLRGTTDGSNPTSASTLIDQAYHAISVANQTDVRHFTAFYAAGFTGTLTILYAFSRLNGSGTITCQASTTIPLYLVVEDCGPDSGASGGTNL